MSHRTHEPTRLGSAPPTRWPTAALDLVSSAVRAARVALARHPRVRWLAAGTAAVAAAWSFAAVTADAVDERNSWGDTVEVWVAVRPAHPGESLVAEERLHPAAVVPPGAISNAPGSDSVARRHVERGEVLIDADLAGPPGPAALAPPGSVVVAVADPLLNSVAPGTEVMVAAEGLVLAADAVVTASVDGVIHVAVEAADAAMVAAAAHQHLASVLVPAQVGTSQD